MFVSRIPGHSHLVSDLVNKVLITIYFHSPHLSLQFDYHCLLLDGQ